MATYFDATYYLAQNPDVQAAFGNDAAAAEAHYFANGAAEGRKPAPWFDADYYRANNADLANMSAADAFLHFTVNGINEGRSPQEGIELNAETFQAYAEANPDLVDAFGIEDTAALTDAQVTQLANHFFAFGSAEGREGGPVGEDGGGDVELDELTEALVAYQAALDAKADFLEEAEESDVIEAVIADDDADFDAGDDVEAFIEDEDGLLAWAKAGLTANSDYNFGNVTPSAIAPMIADVQEELAEKLDTAVTEAGKVDKGLKSAIDGAIAGADRLKTSVTAQEKAAKAAAAEFAKADTLTPDLVLEPAAAAGAFVSLKLGEANLVTIDPVTKALVIDNDLAADIEGFDALLASIRAWNTADKVVVSNQTTLTALVTNVNEKETGAVTLADGVLEFNADTKSKAYADAVTAVKNFDEAVDNYEAAAALIDGLAALEDDIDAAEEVFEELGYVVAEGTGVLVGTEANDAFVFATDSDDEALFETITLFGEEGDDVFFIGTEYALGTDVENGNDSVLEVFLTQDGADTLVTVEQTVFGSSAEQQEIWTINLVGVNAEDLSFVDGYVVIA